MIYNIINPLGSSFEVFKYQNKKRVQANLTATFW